MAPSRPSRPMALGLFMHAAGYHEAGWRHPEARSATEDIAHLRDIATLAERGKLHMLFFPDGLSTSATTHPSMMARLDPLAALSALAMHTQRIGLAGTASTTYGEPFHVARAFASLDHLSGGRAGWNVVTSATPRDAGNFSRDEHLAHALRYERAEEFVDVVTGLWDSWAPGALVRERDTGRYVDPERLRPLHHQGRHFQVAGPLNVSRPPQGRPLLIQAGSSGPGMALAARVADVVFTAQQNLGTAREFYRDIRARVASAGRDPGQVRVLPGFMPVIGRSAADARERFEHLQALLDTRHALASLSHRLGVDLSGHDLDGPLPALPPLTQGRGFVSRVKLFATAAQRDHLSLRELYKLIAGTNGHYLSLGTAQHVADEMAHWVAEGAADGFNLVMPYFPGCLADFVEQVVPLLQERGLFHTEYAGPTLRENLGLRPIDGP